LTEHVDRAFVVDSNGLQPAQLVRFALAEAEKLAPLHVEDGDGLRRWFGDIDHAEADGNARRFVDHGIVADGLLPSHHPLEPGFLVVDDHVVRRAEDTGEPVAGFVGRLRPKDSWFCRFCRFFRIDRFDRAATRYEQAQGHSPNHPY
jgi:hypothetical protein